MSTASHGTPPTPLPAASGVAAVIGAGGGIGAALLAQLRADRRYGQVLGIGRRVGDIALDLHDEASIAAAASRVASRLVEAGLPLRLVVVATGVLHGDAGLAPEKSWRELDAARLARVFATNAGGGGVDGGAGDHAPAADDRAVFAVLSAKVGSIGDNRLGGWYGYRASKAALNQLLRCAAIELRRSRPQAICAALHPGTVDTALSRPFAKSGLQVRAPADAARRLLAVVDRLTPADSGGFFDHDGAALPW